MRSAKKQESSVKARRKLYGQFLELFLMICTCLVIGIIGFILVTIIAGSWHTLSWNFIVSAPKNGMQEGGIFPAIYGTFLLVCTMSVVVMPVGVATAFHLAEYARPDSITIRITRFGINTLAAVPSIVFGLFGLGFFIRFIGGGIDSVFYGKGQLVWAQPNILWASLTMALLTLPVVIVSVEEAIKTVPQELRQASLALGASKWQTVVHVVLPQSLTGILTGGILAISRGAGEVAPLLFTGAAYFLPNLPTALSDQFMQLGYHVYIMATQSPDVEATKGIQFATTAVLLALTFLLNSFAIFLRYHIRKRNHSV
ncbi:MAG: phosphate ABC transporter permease PstA [Chitinivibrionales bacterium]|nr:phosphate ABC transporter permease PstA [Chitinivibrionales bacterium]